MAPLTNKKLWIMANKYASDDNLGSNALCYKIQEEKRQRFTMSLSFSIKKLGLLTLLFLLYKKLNL